MNLEKTYTTTTYDGNGNKIEEGTETVRVDVLKEMQRCNVTTCLDLGMIDGAETLDYIINDHLTQKSKYDLTLTELLLLKNNAILAENKALLVRLLEHIGDM